LINAPILVEKLVWITGAGGLIGNYLVQTAREFAPAWKIFGLTRSNCDLTDPKNIEGKFRSDKPNLIIHCAAISKGPACQANPALAWKINVEATKILAELAAEIPFIFFSTDLIFDGKKGNYVENDAPNPLSVYAETKLAAEKIVLENPKHAVVRTSLNAGISPTEDRAFNEELKHLWTENKTANLFTDEFRCPIPASVTARAIWELAQKNIAGIFHLAGSEKLSRFEIGQLLAARLPELNPKLEAGSLRDYVGSPRSPDTSLDCAKIQKLLSFPLPRFSDWLKKTSAEI
jgi:dTDP-4-dehydrorhamnose reductase